MLTSVGRRTYMVEYFKKALDGAGEVHAANSVKTYALQMADKSVVTPLIYDKSYIDFLLQYCRTNSIRAIIPLFDIDLPILSKSKQVFKDYHIDVIVSDPLFIQICNDKWLTSIFLNEKGFKTPRTYVNLDQAKYAIETRQISYPVIVKPRWGMGSIGIYEADDYAELLLFYKKTYRAIQTSYLQFESLESPDNCVLIQEKISGSEHGIDVFNDLNGNYLTCVPKRKLAMRAGETDSAEVLDNLSLLEIGKKLGSLSNHIGNLDVDCFIVNNDVYILELNCRFGGQYPFSHLAGVNFPKALLSMLKEEGVDNECLLFKTGIVGIKDLIPVKIST